MPQQRRQDGPDARKPPLRSASMAGRLVSMEIRHKRCARLACFCQSHNNSERSFGATRIVPGGRYPAIDDRRTVRRCRVRIAPRSVRRRDAQAASARGGSHGRRRAARSGHAILADDRRAGAGLVNRMRRAGVVAAPANAGIVTIAAAARRERAVGASPLPFCPGRDAAASRPCSSLSAVTVAGDRGELKDTRSASKSPPAVSAGGP